MAARNTQCRGDSTFMTVLGAVTVWMVLAAWLAAPAWADLTDYAVFGFHAVDAWYDASIVGSVGSNSGAGSIFLDGGSSVEGNVHTGGTLYLGDGTTVLGNVICTGTLVLYGSGTAVTGNVDGASNVYVGTDCTVTGRVTSAGNPISVFVDDGGRINGDVVAAKNVEVGDVGNPSGLAAVVTGDVTVVSAGNLTIDTADGASVGSITLNPSPPAPAAFQAEALPLLPDFTAGGADVTAGTSLAPGSYGDVLLASSQTLSLTSGNYYFTSFQADDGLTLNLELGGGMIGIYVTGSVYTGDYLDVRLWQSGVEVMDYNEMRALAPLIFSQTKGDWNIPSAAQGEWFGTVYAPDGGIWIGSNFSLTGAIYGNQVSIGDGSVVYAQPVDLESLVIPAPGALVLGMAGLGLVGWLRRRF